MLSLNTILPINDHSEILLTKIIEKTDFIYLYAVLT